MGSDSGRGSDGRIAVVGMSVRYAGCKNKDEFWDSLMSGEVNTASISDKRLGTKRRQDHFARIRNEFADTFCNESYGCVGDDIDNEHDFLLALAKSAIEDAKSLSKGWSQENINLKKWGIISGCLSFPMDNLQGELLNLYQNHIEKAMGPEVLANADEWSDRPAALSPIAGDARSFQDPASFVAKTLGLGALHYSLDAACASALYVLSLAQHHLLSGSVDVVLAGASCLPDPFFILSGFSTFHALPVQESHISTPLNKHSKGLTPGEGGCIMVLKRLDDAVRDGDHIYGTLLGVNLSNAGCGLPLKPHLQSEESCLKDTYKKIKRAPSSVQYVEMHATGTPQGDRIEVEAVKSCFASHSPRFGTTKGNFGHTLAAAGFAGMAKILLSFEKGIIPPTPGISFDNAIDPSVVTKSIGWPDTHGDAKCAALSGFGFGGTNAHAVFEEFVGTPRLTLESHSKQRESKFVAWPVSEEKIDLAIIGLHCTFGTLKDLDSFELALFNGKNGARKLPPKRWRFLGKDKAFLDLLGLSTQPSGCFIKDVDVDFRRLKSPMKPADYLRPMQLLAVSTIDKAILDSGLSKGGKVAVIVGLGTDLEMYRHRARVALKEHFREEVKGDPEMLSKLLQYVFDCGTSTSYTSYIGNLVATRVSSQWGFTGPAFTITEGENSVYRCIDIGKQLVETGDADAIVVAGIDLCGCAESVYLRSQRVKLSSNDSPRAGFDKSSDGFFIGEGCGALVLKPMSKCQSEEKVYACLKGIGMGQSPAESAARALSMANVTPSNVELLELSGISKNLMLPSANCDISSVEKELEDLGMVFGGSGRDRKYSLGCVKSTVGDVGYASGAASLIKVALALYNRYLPGTPDFDSLVEGNWSDCFFVPQTTQPWVKNPNVNRLAFVSGLSSDSRSTFSLILSDTEQHESHPRFCFDSCLPRLITVSGLTVEEIERKLTRHIDACAKLDPSDHLERLVGSTLQEASRGSRQLFCLSLVATIDRLEAELRGALNGVRKAKVSKKDYQAPSGSFFSPNPINSDKIAFMYGDARSPYCGITRDLSRIYPGAHDLINNKIPDLWSEDDRWLFPRSCGKDEAKRLRKEFSRNQVEMFRAGVYSSICFSALMTNVAGLKPKAYFGLSLGEVCMLFALSDLNCKNSDKMTKRLRESSVWTSKLAVKFDAIREEWNIPANTPIEEFWKGYIVRASRSQIEQAIGKNERVRLLIVNDDASALIAGSPTECEKVIAQISPKSRPLAVEQGMIAHCPDVIPYCEEIDYIHSVLEIPSTDYAMYTSTTNSRLVPENALSYPPGSARMSAGKFTSTLYSQIADFPKVLKTVRSDGYDVFVEAGANCLRAAAVKSILGTESRYVAVSADRENENSWIRMLKSLAILMSHRVPGATVSNIYHPRYASMCLSKLKYILEPIPVNKFQQSLEMNEFFSVETPKIINSLKLKAIEDVEDMVFRRRMRKPERIEFDNSSVDSTMEESEKTLRTQMKSSIVLEPDSKKQLTKISEKEYLTSLLKAEKADKLGPSISVESLPNGHVRIDGTNVYSIADLCMRFMKANGMFNAPFNPQAPPDSTTPTEMELQDIQEMLLDLDQTFRVSCDEATGKIYHATQSFVEDVVSISRCTISDLGDKRFMEVYGVSAPLYIGAMANGISSPDLVVAAGKRKILSSFGIAGLSMNAARDGLEKIQAELPIGPYAVNLVHSPFDPNLEKRYVDLFLEKGVRTVEASAFTTLTLQLVRYRAVGLFQKANGKIHVGNHIIAKVSRVEVAEIFARPAPSQILSRLVASGSITAVQAKLASLVPVADDICIEADSGGLTDQRPIHVMLPLVISMKDRVCTELGYTRKLRPRIGAGGGIGCARAAHSAFTMGAAFIVTGSVNQIARQSGTCDHVRSMLRMASYTDTAIAPVARMPNGSTNVQVLKKGTMFSSKASKVYEIYRKYESLDKIPQRERLYLEKRVFQKPVEEFWDETKRFYESNSMNLGEIRRAEIDDKVKFSLCCKRYLDLTSEWARDGTNDQKLDYQVWCGPSIGSFNDFIEGTYLDPMVNGVYPCVAQINLQILRGACYYRRLMSFKTDYLSSDIDIDDPIFDYIPTVEV